MTHLSGIFGYSKEETKEDEAKEDEAIQNP